MSRKLAILIATSPDSGDFERALVIARAARAADIEVGIFFMDAGVETLSTARSDAADLSNLGCDLIVCASSAQDRSLTAADLGGVLLGSQDDHAALVHEAHRVVAFA